MTYIRHKAGIDENLFKNPVYFFGYGSLMYPSGINGRGMKTIYRSDMLDVCRLGEFKRGSYAEFKGKYYYSLIPSSESRVLGVVFRIDTADDLNALLKDEGAHNLYRDTPEGVMYDVTNVTDHVCDIWLPENAIVFTLIHPYDKTRKDGIMEPWYINHVWKGIQMHGEDFVKEFLQTGGVAADGGSKCLTSVSSKT